MSKVVRDEVIAILKKHGPLKIGAIFEKSELALNKNALGVDLNFLKRQGDVVLQDGNLWSLNPEKHPAGEQQHDLQIDQWQADGGRDTEAADEAIAVESLDLPAEPAKDPAQAKPAGDTEGEFAPGAPAGELLSGANKETRYHPGGVSRLGPDEVPIILKPGEEQNDAEQIDSQIALKDFRCALASDYSLIIQDGDNHMTLSPQKTRAVIDYLDHLLLDDGTPINQALANIQREQDQKQPWMRRMWQRLIGAAA